MSSDKKMKREYKMITERRFKNAKKAFYNIPHIFCECENMEHWTIRDYVSEVAYQLKKYFDTSYSQADEYQDALSDLQDCKDQDIVNDKYWKRKYDEANFIIEEWNATVKAMRKFIKTYQKDAIQEKCYMRHCSPWDSKPFKKAE